VLNLVQDTGKFTFPSLPPTSNPSEDSAKEKHESDVKEQDESPHVGNRHYIVAPAGELFHCHTKDWLEDQDNAASDDDGKPAA
jgi:hypothetical protein